MTSRIQVERSVEAYPDMKVTVPEWSTRNPSGGKSIQPRGTLAASSFENQCPDSTAVFADGDCAFADEPPQPAAAITSTHNPRMADLALICSRLSQTNHAEGYVPPSPRAMQHQGTLHQLRIGPARHCPGALGVFATQRPTWAGAPS
jgi:hypothetical protein